MANNLIQIKRSTSTAITNTTPSISSGELIFTSNGYVLAIGDPANSANVIAIGGARYPGVLTANQALVANSISAIDKIIVANLVPSSIYANGTLGTANQVLRSNGSIVYWSDDVGDISSVVAGSGLTGGGTTGDITVNVGQGNGIAVEVDSIRVQQANGIAVDAGGVRVDGGSTLTVNNSGVHVNTNLSITSLTTSGNVTVNGNTKLGDATSDVVSFIASVNTNILPSVNATYSLGNNSTRWFEVHAANVHSTTGYFDGSVQIVGDLIVAGNVTTTNVQSVIISDPLIYLAGNNYSSDLVDIGFAANYNDGTNRHTGLFRDASDGGVYKLFTNLTQELSSAVTVNTADPTFATASLQTYLISGGLLTNATHVAITANSTVNVSIAANTLTLSAPLAATSGGTGTGTYTTGDILVANTGNVLTKLSLGTSGYVLQSNGSSLVYATLDGGTF